MERAPNRFEWPRDTVSGSIGASSLVCLGVLHETPSFSASSFSMLLWWSLAYRTRNQREIIRKPPSPSASILDHTLQFLPTRCVAGFLSALLVATQILKCVCAQGWTTDQHQLVSRAAAVTRHKVEVDPLFARHSFLCPRQAHDEPLVLGSFRPHAALLLKMSHARSEHWQTHAGHSDFLSVASRCHLLASESACVLVVRSRGLLDIRTECKLSCLDTRFHIVRRLRSFARLLLSLFSHEQRSTCHSQQRHKRQQRTIQLRCSRGRVLDRSSGGFS